MPWTSSKEVTLPSLKNKSQEAREIFARVANAALAKGQSEEESIQAGLFAIAAHERKKARESKSVSKSLQSNISKTHQNALQNVLSEGKGVDSYLLQKAATEPLKTS